MSCLAIGTFCTPCLWQSRSINTKTNIQTTTDCKLFTTKRSILCCSRFDNWSIYDAPAKNTFRHYRRLFILSNLTGLGSIKYQEMNYDAAIELFEKILEYNPDHVDALDGIKDANIDKNK